MIFLLDNYDSFSYNLYQLLLSIGCEVKVARNDKVTPEEVVATKPDCVVLSPGPGRPESAGVMQELIAQTAQAGIPQLGVCLGMQGIGIHCGAKVVLADEIMHGKTCKISHDGLSLYKGLPERLEVMRYHSLVLDEDIPEELLVTAKSDDGEIMGIRHRDLPLEGVQFHPESFATSEGEKMISNFLGSHGIL